MRRVLVTGAAGRMGTEVRAAVASQSELTLGAALEHATHPRLGEELAPGVLLQADPGKAVAACDLAIDFSLPEASLALVREALRVELPLVIGTTGFDEVALRELDTAARTIPILRAPNFSLGVNVLLELVAQAARALPDYDVEVLELHHTAKVDAPSGTALRLGEAAAEARGHALAERAVYHREGQTGPRTKGSIGLQTLRAGDAPGEHTVYVAGAGERLELTHRALSRRNFAEGAVRAALWLHGRPPGQYTMQDVLAG